LNEIGGDYRQRRVGAADLKAHHAGGRCTLRKLDVNSEEGSFIEQRAFLI
jgi:hypothetical protein